MPSARRRGNDGRHLPRHVPHEERQYGRHDPIEDPAFMHLANGNAVRFLTFLGFGEALWGEVTLSVAQRAIIRSPIASLWTRSSASHDGSVNSIGA